jgi:hypothetical protein
MYHHPEYSKMDKEQERISYNTGFDAGVSSMKRPETVFVKQTHPGVLWECDNCNSIIGNVYYLVGFRYKFCPVCGAGIIEYREGK